MSNAVVKLMFIAVLSISSIRSITVRNGAYHNIVIEIDREVPVDDCSNFLLNLESALKSSSENLYASVDGRIYYASFDIILPLGWPNDCVCNKTVSNHNGVPSDVTITAKDEIFGDGLWTQQSGGCGERGDQIFIGYKSINSQNVSEKFTVEWMKYKYGVFDVNGFENDPLYPPCGVQGDRKQICNDASNIEISYPRNSQNSSQLFAYNRYSPSKHNHLCKRQHPMDVINSNEDFNTTDRHQKFVEPTFKYVKKTLTRYMVIIDDHSDINVRDSFQFLRDAMRKWLEKDLDRERTEVGIWLMGNGSTKSEDFERNLIKSLRKSDDREEIFSILPWYIEQRGHSKCQLDLAITRSIEIMKRRSQAYGDANSVILVIAPGMSKCPDDDNLLVIDKANQANIKISTINYPSIGQNRIEMDRLASQTGGKAFTIVEQKQSSDRSLLTTFFDLTNTLFHISGIYNAGDVSGLPVEIYRKELVDTGSKDENKPTLDSFNVDEATDFINFFVYIYDRKERNIEKGMRLVAPNRHEFSTSSELRAEYHQISIVGNLTGYGSWSYNIKRFCCNPQPHFVQILAYPKLHSSDFIRAKVFIRRPRKGGPQIVYAQVMQGKLPIVDALVEMSVKHNGQKITTAQLFDNGSGDPDVTRGDGIYSRYFAISEPGMYTFQLFVSDNGNVAYVKGSLDDQPESTTQTCCGSVIPIFSKQTVASFQRFLIPLTVFISAEDIEHEQKTSQFIGRIGDLRWSQMESDPKIVLEWSNVDCGREDVKVVYEIRYTMNLKDLEDDFDTLTNKLTTIDTIPHIIGQVASVTINLADEPTLIDQPFYIAVKSIVLGELDGPVSNFIRIFVPKKRVTPVPHFGSDPFNRDTFETDPSIKVSAENEGVFPNSTEIAGISLEVLIAIVLCSLFGLIIILLYCWCCIRRKRKFESAKKTPIKSPAKPAISVIVPLSTPNQYNIDPMNSTMYYADVPDLHTVGLPCVDEDISKPDYIDQDKMLFDEMRHHRQFQQQAVMDSYDPEYVITGNGTLTRNGRYLSPFESWTASQLLVEHERRQSPIEHDPIMYVDAHGELVPPIPPHPYQGNYSTPINDQRMPPPQYSSVYRPLVRTPAQGGSMQSVCGTMQNGDKKIRNVTMV